MTPEKPAKKDHPFVSDEERDRIIELGKAIMRINADLYDRWKKFDQGLQDEGDSPEFPV